MLATRLSASAVSSSSSTLLSNSHCRLRVAKRIPFLAKPSLFNPLRPIVEWSSAKKNSSRKMDASASSRIVSAAEQLKDPDQLIDSVETFIFDCDGVIWKGDKLIDGVPETLDMLRAKGKRLVFVTNNSTKSRKQYGKKFETLGLNVSEEEIFASSFAAAAYLNSIDFPKDKKVYVVGEEGILKELELAGFQYLGGPEDGDKKIELKPGYMMEHDENVGAVVVGFDRYFNYYKIQYATLCIRENPGCLFIATNRDAVTHLTDAQEWAGGGSMVGAVRGSTQREPLVVGKPSTFMMDYLADKFKISKSQICMVGDRLDTDILFGQNGGCKTLLVLSGVTTLPVLQNPCTSCCQVNEGFSCCQNPMLQEIKDDPQVAAPFATEMKKSSKKQAARNNSGKGIGPRKVCSMPTWYECWEREDTYAALAVIMAAVSVAFTYKCYKQLG